MRLRLNLAPAQGELPPGQVSEHVFDERGGVIGRSPACDWVLLSEDKLVSRRHAVIAHEQGEFVIYDASANGIFHNSNPQPVGPGGRVVLHDGDTLRVGEFTLCVALIETATATPSVTVAPAATVVPLRLVEKSRAATLPPAEPTTVTAAEPALARQPRLPALGQTNDAFQPPEAVIPEDWDLELNGDPEAAERSSTLDIVRHLNTLEPVSARALLQGLQLTDELGEETQLTPELIHAMACILRLSVQGVFALRTEYDEVERRLTRGRSLTMAKGTQALGEFTDAKAFCRALITADDEERDRMVFALGDAVVHLQGKHHVVAESFDQSMDTVLEQFAPERFAERFSQRLAELGRLRRLALRLTRALFPGMALWRFYRVWHEAQRTSGYAAVRKLFEVKTIALYAARARVRSARHGK